MASRHRTALLAVLLVSTAFFVCFPHIVFETFLKSSTNEIAELYHVAEGAREAALFESLKQGRGSHHRTEVARLSGPQVAAQRPFDHTRDILLVPTRGGTYLCEYMTNATHVREGCVQQCFAQKSHGVKGTSEFNCHLRSRFSESNAKHADIIVNHQGPVPRRGENGLPYITLFYTGESNWTDQKRGNDVYQSQYDMVVSFDRRRPLHFTWTHRQQPEFMKIMENNEKGIGPSADAVWEEWQRRIPAVAIFLSRCEAGRDAVIRGLSAFYPVHSYGKCAKNQLSPPDCKRFHNRYQEKLCVLGKYKYAFAMENSAELNYVTEKVYHGLLSGTVPLYWGAPNVEEFVPGGRKSFVDIEQHLPNQLGTTNTPSSEALQRLGEYLRRMETDRAAVDSIFAWRLARRPEEWGGAFWDSLHHPDPICDICTEARKRRGD